jgi:hypothetical protein
VAAITGQVTDEETGEPIEGVYVRATLSDGSRSTTKTDSDGRYTLALQGAASVRVRTGELLTQRNWVYEVWDDMPCTRAEYNTLVGCGPGQVLEIADGEVRSGIDFALARGVFLSGRVLDSTSGGGGSGDGGVVAIGIYAAPALNGRCVPALAFDKSGGSPIRRLSQASRILPVQGAIPLASDLEWPTHDLVRVHRPLAATLPASRTPSRPAMPVLACGQARGCA